MTEAKRLYRSLNDRKLAGVCGGLGKYFNIDPVIFRLLFVFAALPGGLPGIIMYILMWIVIPEEPVKADRLKSDA